MISPKNAADIEQMQDGSSVHGESTTQNQGDQSGISMAQGLGQLFLAANMPQSLNNAQQTFNQGLQSFDQPPHSIDPSQKNSNHGQLSLSQGPQNSNQALQSLDHRSQGQSQVPHSISQGTTDNAQQQANQSGIELSLFNINQAPETFGGNAYTDDASGDGSAQNNIAYQNNSGILFTNEELTEQQLQNMAQWVAMQQARLKAKKQAEQAQMQAEQANIAQNQESQQHVAQGEIQQQVSVPSNLEMQGPMYCPEPHNVDEPFFDSDQEDPPFFEDFPSSQSFEPGPITPDFQGPPDVSDPPFMDNPYFVPEPDFYPDLAQEIGSHFFEPDYCPDFVQELGPQSFGLNHGDMGGQGSPDFSGSPDMEEPNFGSAQDESPDFSQQSYDLGYDQGEQTFDLNSASYTNGPDFQQPEPQNFALGQNNTEVQRFSDVNEPLSNYAPLPEPVVGNDPEIAFKAGSGPVFSEEFDPSEYELHEEESFFDQDLFDRDENFEVQPDNSDFDAALYFGKEPDFDKPPLANEASSLLVESQHIASDAQSVQPHSQSGEKEQEIELVLESPLQPEAAQELSPKLSQESIEAQPAVESEPEVEVEPRQLNHIDVWQRLVTKPEFTEISGDTGFIKGKLVGQNYSIKFMVKDGVAYAAYKDFFQFVAGKALPLYEYLNKEFVYGKDHEAFLSPPQLERVIAVSSNSSLFRVFGARIADSLRTMSDPSALDKVEEGYKCTNGYAVQLKLSRDYCAVRRIEGLDVGYEVSGILNYLEFEPGLKRQVFELSLRKLGLKRVCFCAEDRDGIPSAYLSKEYVEFLCALCTNNSIQGFIGKVKSDCRDVYDASQAAALLEVEQKKDLSNLFQHTLSHDIVNYTYTEVELKVLQEIEDKVGFKELGIHCAQLPHSIVHGAIAEYFSYRPDLCISLEAQRQEYYRGFFDQGYFYVPSKQAGRFIRGLRTAIQNKRYNSRNKESSAKQAKAAAKAQKAAQPQPESIVSVETVAHSSIVQNQVEAKPQVQEVAQPQAVSLVSNETGAQGPIVQNQAEARSQVQEMAQPQAVSSVSNETGAQGLIVQNQVAAQATASAHPQLANSVTNESDVFSQAQARSQTLPPKLARDPFVYRVGSQKQTEPKILAEPLLTLEQKRASVLTDTFSRLVPVINQKLVRGVPEIYLENEQRFTHEPTYLELLRQKQFRHIDLLAKILPAQSPAQAISSNDKVMVNIPFIADNFEGFDPDFKYINSKGVPFEVVKYNPQEDDASQPYAAQGVFVEVDYYTDIPDQVSVFLPNEDGYAPSGPSDGFDYIDTSLHYQGFYKDPDLNAEKMLFMMANNSSIGASMAELFNDIAFQARIEGIKNFVMYNCGIKEPHGKFTLNPLNMKVEYYEQLLMPKSEPYRINYGPGQWIYLDRRCDPVPMNVYVDSLCHKLAFLGSSFNKDLNLLYKLAHNEGLDWASKNIGLQTLLRLKYIQKESIAEMLAVFDKDVHDFADIESVKVTCGHVWYNTVCGALFTAKSAFEKQLEIRGLKAQVSRKIPKDVNGCIHEVLFNKPRPHIDFSPWDYLFTIDSEPLKFIAKGMQEELNFLRSYYCEHEQTKCVYGQPQQQSFAQTDQGYGGMAQLYSNAARAQQQNRYNQNNKAQNNRVQQLISQQTSVGGNNQQVQAQQQQACGSMPQQALQQQNWSNQNNQAQQGVGQHDQACGNNQQSQFNQPQTQPQQQQQARGPQQQQSPQQDRSNQNNKVQTRVAQNNRVQQLISQQTNVGGNNQQVQAQQQQACGSMPQQALQQQNWFNQNNQAQQGVGQQDQAGGNNQKGQFNQPQTQPQQQQARGPQQQQAPQQDWSNQNNKAQPRSAQNNQALQGIGQQDHASDNNQQGLSNQTQAQPQQQQARSSQLQQSQQPNQPRINGNNLNLHVLYKIKPGCDFSKQKPVSHKVKEYPFEECSSLSDFAYSLAYEDAYNLAHNSDHASAIQLGYMWRNAPLFRPVPEEVIHPELIDIMRKNHTSVPPLFVAATDEGPLHLHQPADYLMNPTVDMYGYPVLPSVFVNIKGDESVLTTPPAAVFGSDMVNNSLHPLKDVPLPKKSEKTKREEHLFNTVYILADLNGGLPKTKSVRVKSTSKCVYPKAKIENLEPHLTCTYHPINLANLPESSRVEIVGGLADPAPLINKMPMSGWKPYRMFFGFDYTKFNSAGYDGQCVDFSGYRSVSKRYSNLCLRALTPQEYISLMLEYMPSSYQFGLFLQELSNMAFQNAVRFNLEMRTRKMLAECFWLIERHVIVYLRGYSKFVSDQARRRNRQKYVFSQEEFYQEPYNWMPGYVNPQRNYTASDDAFIPKFYERASSVYTFSDVNWNTVVVPTPEPNESVEDYLNRIAPSIKFNSQLWEDIHRLLKISSEDGERWVSDHPDTTLDKIIQSFAARVVPYFNEVMSQFDEHIFTKQFNPSCFDNVSQPINEIFDIIVEYLLDDLAYDSKAVLFTNSLRSKVSAFVRNMTTSSLAVKGNISNKKPQAPQKINSPVASIDSIAAAYGYHTQIKHVLCQASKLAQGEGVLDMFVKSQGFIVLTCLKRVFAMLFTRLEYHCSVAAGIPTNSSMVLDTMNAYPNWMESGPLNYNEFTTTDKGFCLKSTDFQQFLPLRTGVSVAVPPARPGEDAMQYINNFCNKPFSYATGGWLKSMLINVSRASYYDAVERTRCHTSSIFEDLTNSFTGHLVSYIDGYMSQIAVKTQKHHLPKGRP